MGKPRFIPEKKTKARNVTETIGIGVLGMGWMGNVHGRSYRNVADRFPDVALKPRLVVCADDVESRAQMAQQRLGFEKSTTDWQAVVDDPAVDVINVAAPNHLHVDLVKAAASRGKHVFCEKPVGRSFQEAILCADAVREANVLSWVGFNYRWVPLLQYLQGLIQNGQLGTITHYRSRFFAGYGSHPQSVLSWRFQREFAGTGVLGDLMSHVLDMALFLAGPIQRVVANQHTYISERPLATPGAGTHFTIGNDGPLGAVSNEDYVSALAQFSNGAQGTFEVCRVIRGPACEFALEVNGTLGAARWNFERMNELELDLPTGDRSSSGFTRILAGPEHPLFGQFNPGAGNPMGYEDLKMIEAYRFLESIAADEQRQPGLEEMRRVAQLFCALEKSSESETWENVNAAT